MKMISYSLWGNDPKYTVGAIKNAQLLSEVYPDWHAKYYVDITVPSGILVELESYKNVQVVVKRAIGNWTSQLWRYAAAYDSGADVAIFRDTDSRINMREKCAVDEWIKSDKTFHIMRDHPYHKCSPILGGMWGVKKNDKYDLKSLVENFYNTESKNQYETDYDFLGKKLFPLAKDDSIIHDEFFGGTPFPCKRQGLEFVGKIFDENDAEPFPEHSLALERSK